MKDPTRIPRVLDALRQVWEGQPDLELAALWGVIGNHGVGWGTDDEALLAVLGEMSATYPARLDDASFPGRLAIIDTQSPARRITVDGDTRRVSVRARSGDLVPATWLASSLKTVVASAPLILTDGNGIDHRLGVVERIHVVDKPVPGAGGTWGVLLEREAGQGTDFAVIGHGVRIFRAGRRSVDTENHSFDRLLRVEVGQPLQIEHARRVSSLGVVAEIFPLDV
ncbi:hypothetical protein [Corynebacterium guangdongense]|uniref:Uncharacterized protein n=1 Tax=Corynebacterium guangdongense TaxID=1783348 RepID=A0ABU1ZU93_9CORY|nr:hypothetical protein [Corynebacterium guangdongense]MDR7328496.1 hypothetical protein [Corynebacterium guangdongense]WJZ17073.1 hypothetical protein CGUA_02385 [Corynebacterium guangdongense]